MPQLYLCRIHFIFLLFHFHFLIVSCYHFERCELAKKLIENGIPSSQINDCKFQLWTGYYYMTYSFKSNLSINSLFVFHFLNSKGICLVEGESQFNSSAIGSMNWDGSKDYGLFQISEKYWCLPRVKRTTGCKLKCEGRISENYVTDCKKHTQRHILVTIFVIFVLRFD